MKKIFTGVVIFFTGLACGLVFVYGPLHAQTASESPDVLAKLNEISRSQQDIVSGINSMKEDLQIIKVRVTQLQ